MIISINEKNFDLYCNDILNINKNNSLEYNQDFLKYLKEVSTNGTVIDKSFVVLQEKKPVALFLGNISSKKKKILKMYSLSCTYFEGNSFIKKSTKKLIIEHFKKIFTECKEKIEFEDYLKDGKINIITEYLISKKAEIKHKIYKKIDLSQSENDLRQSIRKSYKSLLNWGEREIKIKFYDDKNISKEIFEVYKSLHFEVTEKKTRSDKSWEIQYDLIKSRNCFLVLGEYKKDIVSGGMFFNNGFVCNYGSSVSKRELFHKPIFHNMLWSSFLFAKQKKFQSFLIQWGELKKKNTKKEESINLFKDGFGGENQLTLNLILK